MGNLINQAEVYIIDGRRKNNLGMVCVGCGERKELLIWAKPYGMLCKKCYHRYEGKATGSRVTDMTDERVFTLVDVIRETLDMVGKDTLRDYTSYTQNISFVTFMSYLKYRNVYRIITKTYTIKIVITKDESRFFYQFVRNDGQDIQKDNKSGFNNEIRLSPERDALEIAFIDRVFKGECLQRLNASTKGGV